MRRVHSLGVSLVLATLLAALVPASSAGGVLSAEASLADPLQEVEQGASVFFHVVLWNNGTQDTARFSVSSTLATTTPAPVTVPALKSADAYVGVFPSGASPLGNATVRITVTWDTAPGAPQTLNATAHVVRPSHGLGIQIRQSRMTYGLDAGGWLDVNLTHNGDEDETVQIQYRIDDPHPGRAFAGATMNLTVPAFGGYSFSWHFNFTPRPDSSDVGSYRFTATLVFFDRTTSYPWPNATVPIDIVDDRPAPPPAPAHGASITRSLVLSPPDAATSARGALDATVWNNGTTTDTATFTTVAVTPTWDIGVAPPFSQSVPPGGSAQASYTVSEDGAVPPGTYLVHARVSWSTGDANDVFANVTVIQPPTANATFSPANATVDPGATTEYVLTIQDRYGHGGRYHATFGIAAPGPDDPVLEANRTVVDLAPYGSDTIRLTASATPRTPTGEHWFYANVTVNATGAPAGWANAVLYARPPTQNATGENASVAISPSYARVAPGGTALYTVTVAERAGRTTTLDLYANETVNATRATLDNQSLTLSPYEQANVTLRVTPSDATPLGWHDVRVTAYSRAYGAPLAWASAVYNVTPPAPTSTVTLSLQPASAHTTTGGAAAFTAILRETTGRATSVRLVLDPAPSVPERPHASPREIALDLQPYEQRNVTFQENASEDVPPGTYDVEAQALDATDARVLADAHATLVVEPSPAGATARVEATVDPQAPQVAAGASVDVAVNVTNVGGANAVVAIEASSANGSLALGGTTRANVTLAPGQSGRAPLRLAVPVDAAPGRYPIVVTLAVPGRPPVVAGAVLFVLPPHGIVARADPQEGPPNATVTVRVHATNVGTRPALVGLSADADVGLPARTLTLAPGETTLVDVTLLVPADAAPGTTLHRALTLQTDEEIPVDLAVTVSPPLAAPPPPPATSRSLLHDATQLALAHPAAAVSLGLAGASLAALPLARRQSVRWLVLTAALPLYTRLASPDMLADEHRGQIHAIVADKPGIHLLAVKKAVGLSASATVHHLRMLERHGFLVSRRDGKLRRFYVSGAAPRTATPGPTAMQEQILGLLSAGPLTRPEIGERLGLSQQGVSYHVKNLERVGRVVVRREGGRALVHRVVDVVVATETETTGET